MLGNAGRRCLEMPGDVWGCLENLGRAEMCQEMPPAPRQEHRSLPPSPALPSPKVPQRCERTYSKTGFRGQS